jgi:hypothetical protein
VTAGADLLTDGSYDDLFYRPTVLANAGPGVPAYDNEAFDPVAAVTSFAAVDEAAKLAADSEFGLTLGILTADVATGSRSRSAFPPSRAHQRPDHQRRGPRPVRRHAPGQAGGLAWPGQDQPAPADLACRYLSAIDYSSS